MECEGARKERDHREEEVPPVVLRARSVSLLGPA